jgi:hypothetical protein
LTGLKDSFRDLQINFAISFYFRLYLMSPACVTRFDLTENLEKFLLFGFSEINYGPGGFGLQIPPPRLAALRSAHCRSSASIFSPKKKKQRPAAATLAYRVKKIVLAILIDTANFLLLPQWYSFF